MEFIAFLLLYFTGNGESGLHLAHSDDGFVWKKDSDSILKPLPGTLIRDPHLTMFNDKAVAVWTTQWWGTDLGIATTTDPKTFSPARRIDVMKDIPGTLNVWAPESVVDPKTGKLIIFWSSTVEGKFEETAHPDGDKDAQGRPLNHRFYYTTTPDLVAFAPPKLLWDPGFNCIDATMIKFRGSWVMIGKDETKAPKPAKSLFVASAPHPLGPWKIVKRQITSGDHWAEGPTAVVVGDQLRVYYDRYMDNRWGVIETKDLINWKDVSGKIKMIPGARHGTVFKPR